MTHPTEVEHLLRALAPQVLGTLARRHRDFGAGEDAVQEALLAASLQWPRDGVPENPRAWLLTVATRRLVDRVRSDDARRRREEPIAAAAADAVEVPDRDDTLTLLFLCCHPSLTSASQLALTLRAVGGLTTAEIAGAFFVPEATMAQRISRAKQRIRAAGASFELPSAPEQEERLRIVLHVLYLLFNEGYTASSGEALQRTELSAEAIRLTRALHGLRPDDGEVEGLLALMLLTDARRDARSGPAGELIPIDRQDRTRWDPALIAEGVALITHALATAARLGPYQVQAAIAAVHDEAETAAETDWPQVLALYELLERLAPNPMVTLNRAVAVAEVHGPRPALDLLAGLDEDERVARHHRLLSVRAHLLEDLGETAAAHDAYRAAARRTTSRPEQRYLLARAARLSGGSGRPAGP